MSADEGVLLYAYRGCVFRGPDAVQPAKAGAPGADAPEHVERFIIQGPSRR